ncbi:unnamed protein product [Amaranthus hypochondriacus]
MSIKVKESTMIFASKETPRVNLWLSKLDMTIRTPYSHTNVLYVYHPQPQNKSSPNFFDTKILKESLSQTLTKFYPTAGRLIFNDKNGRYEIDCNTQGALFVEAETISPLSDFGDYYKQDCELRKMVFAKCDYSLGLSMFPLMMVQLTRFGCGSVCIGFSQHHHVADGASHLLFNNSWARLAKGLELLAEPVHDRAKYFGPRDPPQVKFRHLEYEPPLPSIHPKDFLGEMATTMESSFKLTKEQMDTILLQATSQLAPQTKKPSTFVVQAAHVWRTACKARGLAHDQNAKIYIPVNGRSRLNDMALPEGYYGNVTVFASCIEKAGDITSKPLSYTARKLHESLKRIDTEYIRSAVDCLESHQDLTAITRGPKTSTCPNLTVNSWARLPCYEADFGWGPPSFTGINGIKFEGQTYITASSNEDGSSFVAIKLFTPHMKLFEKYLYDF